MQISDVCAVRQQPWPVKRVPAVSKHEPEDVVDAGRLLGQVGRAGRVVGDPALADLAGQHPLLQDGRPRLLHAR
jgi:hypothetical protein